MAVNIELRIAADLLDERGFPEAAQALRSGEIDVTMGVDKVDVMGRFLSQLRSCDGYVVVKADEFRYLLETVLGILAEYVMDPDEGYSMCADIESILKSEPKKRRQLPTMFM